MGIFKPAENSVSYAKIGVVGFQGSGKTHTSALIAIGLYQYIKSKHPVFFYDTETGSNYVKPKFDKAGVPLMRVQSRAFATLIGAMREVPEGGIMLLDSITHPWRDLTQSFMKAKGVTRIQMHHWPVIKQEWGQFNDWFLNSKVHIIMCGRAGYEYDFEENDEGGKDLVKTGIKMKSEGEIGFEPSLNIEMMAETVVKKGKITGIKNKAFILKDRFDVMNGKMFDEPTFETFLPHISLLNLNGKHEALDGVDSSTMFNTDNSVSKRLRERDILVEELKNEMSLRFSSRTDAGKAAGLAFLKEAYGTTSMTASEGMQNDRIRAGLDQLKLIPTAAGKE